MKNTLTAIVLLSALTGGTTVLGVELKFTVKRGNEQVTYTPTSNITCTEPGKAIGAGETRECTLNVEGAQKTALLQFVSNKNTNAGVLVNIENGKITSIETKFANSKFDKNTNTLLIP